MGGGSWLVWRQVSILYPLWGELSPWVDEQQPLFPGRAHSPDLTNIYLSFPLPLPPLWDLFFLFSQAGCFHLQLRFLRTALGSPCAVFSTIIIFLNLSASLCSITWHPNCFLLSASIPLATGGPTYTALQQAALANLSAFDISLTCVGQPYLIYCQYINSLMISPFHLLLWMWTSFQKNWLLFQ